VDLPGVALLPADPGVYRFRDERGRALYIGRASDLRRRVGSYAGALRDRRHLRRMVPHIARIEAVVCDSGHEAAWLERNLLEHRKPYWNRSRGGQEVPVYLRLDTRGLRVAHEHEIDGRGQVFGPYLGGAKARLAVSALRRALPTGDEVARILSRDISTMDAVRAELVRRRDRAAQALAFELAGRVQLELEALDWITAEQKVTMSTVDCADVDVCGWAAGILVRFELRGGRVRTWTQWRCSESSAASGLAATPVRWRPFAERAATLAAGLASYGPDTDRRRNVSATGRSSSG
jgi:excinuclease ABC subunit C